MSEFEKSNWVEAEYSKKYLDNADNYIPERKTLLRILTSFYRNFIGIGGNKGTTQIGAELYAKNFNYLICVYILWQSILCKNRLNDSKAKISLAIISISHK